MNQVRAAGLKESRAEADGADPRLDGPLALLGLATTGEALPRDVFSTALSCPSGPTFLASVPTAPARGEAGAVTLRAWVQRTLVVFHRVAARWICFSRTGS